MAGGRSPPRSLQLNQVYGFSLDPSKKWYALSSDWCYRIREFMISDWYELLSEDIVEVRISELTCIEGRRVPAEWFGSSRKKDLVVVATLFGILGRDMRRKKPGESKFFRSSEFLLLKEMINTISLHEKMAGSHYQSPEAGKTIFESPVRNHFIETPPSTPEEPIRLTDRPKLKDISKQCEIIERLDLGMVGPRISIKQARTASRAIINNMKSTTTSNATCIGKSLGYSFLYSAEEDKSFAREVVSSAIAVVGKKQGIKNAFSNIVDSDIHSQFINSMRVPDWLQLYVKLSTKLPDKSWQSVLNFLNLGRSGKNIDAGILLTSNEMKAQKELVFNVVKATFDIQPVVPKELRGYGVSLPMVLVWAIRELRLHQGSEHADTLEFNLKLDGRPLAGREQVSVGIVPISSHGTDSSQSALSVYPLSIANCQEKREEVTNLIQRVNKEKNTIKQEGLCVDGKMYKIKFKVTIDYKAMLMLMVKKKDSNFVLGGRGVDVEFCIFCAAKRACLKHWNGAFDEVCAECLASKANIGNWNGFRDDLLFLLEEDLSNICLCSLHQEMRNTEQLLGSLGLFAYRCGTLDECNEAIAGYGPEVSQEYNRIKVQLKPGQQTAVTKSNISVSSFSGTTERKILDNIDDIISRALPVDKVSNYYSGVAGAANTVVIHHITFYHEIIKYLNEDILVTGKFTRAFGTHTQEVSLDDTKILKTFLMESKESWSQELKKLENDYLSCESKTTPRSPKKKKRRKGTNLASSSNSNNDEAYAELAATTQINLFRKVFLEWSNIAETLREFDGDEDEQIDVFDVKCKVWGRCLRHLFGVSLGSGDYGHLTIDHAPMLLRLHGSFRRYSNQGFEASHKVHRALYSRATCHDKGGATESAAQILTHWLSESMLFLRFQFIKARECFSGNGTKCVFYFRGCGWKKKNVNWSGDDLKWIEEMISLFNKIFGEDTMDYTFVKDKGMKVSSSSDPRLAFTYSHAEWESNCDSCPGSTSTNANHSADIINLEDDKHSNTLETDTAPSESESQPIYQAAAKPVTIDLTRDSKPAVQSASHAVYFSSTVTRRELAKLKIPKVANNCIFVDVMPASGKFVDTDPCSLLSRPPQAIVDKAERLCKKASAVKVGGLGTFSQHSINLLRKFCDIANLKKEVQQEEGWLHGSWDGLNQDDVDNIQSLLWDTKLQKTILQIDGKSIDVKSFTTLVGERYLDNFTIDVIIKHFVKDAGGTNQVLYLPSETFTWLQSDDKDFIESQIQKQVGPAFREISLILAPIHMNGMHWGLAVADLTNEKLLFDDGLKMIPGKEVIANMVKCLNIMKTMMSPGMKSFDTAFWCSQADFERFGMPSQGSGEGCGSCGVGVILSARDFIQKGSLAAGRFSWSFKESRFLRKQLMKQIISWAAEQVTFNV